MFQCQCCTGMHTGMKRRRPLMATAIEEGTPRRTQAAVPSLTGAHCLGAISCLVDVWRKLAMPLTLESVEQR